ncbi:hypothetical protein PHSY_002655 [Pseudozyma hubeiensis SY62]|uniref:Uncharacterized protein n=1 Tax=Pseudozyma hubeiensis (strain SY62) TaxID=1305764 RepID=R9PAE9_PSEHS|nr:hypothetical protein PHSY_002655 [Pseudozyma hubeiensis SY62]GAC95080.1 hypothetical protein PHSY_002655 [Pseudozyma hubeiensis SY62]
MLCERPRCFGYRGFDVDRRLLYFGGNVDARSADQERVDGGVGVFGKEATEEDVGCGGDSLAQIETFADDREYCRSKMEKVSVKEKESMD